MAAGEQVPAPIDRIAAEIVDAGFQVHKTLGPGLLESAYEECLAHDLFERGLSVRRQVAMPIAYKGVNLDAGYRIDLLVDSCVVVEVKAIESLLPIHQAQVMTYLRLSGCRLGFLMNFNVQMFKTGVRRIALYGASRPRNGCRRSALPFGLSILVILVFQYI